MKWMSPLEDGWDTLAPYIGMRETATYCWQWVEESKQVLGSKVLGTVTEFWVETLMKLLATVLVSTYISCTETGTKENNQVKYAASQEGAESNILKKALGTQFEFLWVSFYELMRKSERQQ